MPDRRARAQRSSLRRLGVAFGVLLVVAGISVASLIAGYVNRVWDATREVQSLERPADYPGRPAPVVSQGIPAINYLVATTDAAGTDAVVLAHLSASRRDLTLIAIPPVGLTRTPMVAAAAGTIPASSQETRTVEELTASRVDHLIQFDLDGFGEVVDALGGVELDGRQLDGDEAVEALRNAGPDASRLSGELIRSALIAASADTGMLLPSRFNKLMDAVSSCLRVDTNLTAQRIKQMVLESRVNPAEILVVELPASQEKDLAAGQDALSQLRIALNTDDFREGPGAALVASSQTAGR